MYRKTHPFGAERDVYVAGDGLVTVELGGRVLGLMICFDMEFPEVARALVRGGADMLVTISANPSEFELDHEVFARARALESGLPHVYVNRVGDQDGLSFGGHSTALDQTGRVLAEAGSKNERIVDAEIGDSGRGDPRTRYLELLREDLYDLEPVASGDVEVVREALELGINLDPRLESTWRRASEWLDPDFEYREDPALPGAGTYKGIPAFRQAVTTYYDAMSEMHLQPEEFFDCGDRVLVVISWWARGKSGVEAEMRQAGIFTVSDGKVASWQVVFDCDEAFRAVGLRD